MASVIVFGPTGQIASVAARTAADQGAKVWLAMRDTNKAIPGLDKDSEAAKSFSRVQADLQKPDTVKKAAETSGAKRAFLYLAHGSPDHMKSTFEALKAGGVEFVVFLSSFTILVDRGLRDIESKDVLAYIHAQAEASAEDVFGKEGYIAIRPGAFASNLMQFKAGIAKGEVDMWGGVFEQDNTNPSDIGRVSGHVLVSGPKNGQKKVYVYGPKPRSLHDSVIEIGRVLGKDVKITEKTRDQALKDTLAAGVPEHFAKYLVDVHSTAGPDKGAGERFPEYDQGVKNVELYTGRKSSSLEEWVNENKATFSAD